MAFENILVVDDERVIRAALQTLLRNRRYSVTTAESVAQGLEKIEQGSFDLAFIDLRLPDGDGLKLLEAFEKRDDAPMSVMMTGYASVESAVSCMRLGAFDYLIKPFSNSQIEIIIKKAEEFSHLIKVNQFYATADDHGSQLIGNSPPMQLLQNLINKVAPTESTVLVQGESGTGKELVASEIHRRSNRAQAPFIKVNCAAISEQLIESEFFGHEKGAFTGALQRREGRFELANNGTILLDEISEISPALQAKLLRVLQEKEFERVGGNKTIKVDTRVIATTNRNLEESVQNGDFREDLFYRLNVFPVRNPPLRERKEDIPLLASSFVTGSARQLGVPQPTLTASALKVLQQHEWPGNVRELRNTIERAVILVDPNGQIQPEALGLTKAPDGGSLFEIPPITPTIDPKTRALGLPPQPAPNNAAPGAPATPEADTATDDEDSLPPETATNNSNGGAILPLAEIERREIFRALRHTEGNRSKAAELLGVTARTLRNKLSQYKRDGIDIPEF